MISVIAATTWIAGFSLLLSILGVVSRAIEVTTISRQALTEFQDKNMSDEDKETAFQGYAKRLFILFFLISAGSAAAFALPGGAFWLLGKTQWFSFEALIVTAISWQFLIVSTVVVSAVIVITVRRKT